VRDCDWEKCSDAAGDPRECQGYSRLISHFLTAGIAQRRLLFAVCLGSLGSRAPSRIASGPQVALWEACDRAMPGGFIISSKAVWGPFEWQKSEMATLQPSGRALWIAGSTERSFGSPFKIRGRNTISTTQFPV